MKLKPKFIPSPPRTEKVTLEGSTADQLADYLEYYQVAYQQTILPSELIRDMVSTFMQGDRDFKKWQLQRRAEKS